MTESVGIEGDGLAIFEYAIQMERDGEAYYRWMAGHVPHPGLKQVLRSLADSEVKHRETLEQMRDNRRLQMPQDTVRHEARNIFRALLEEGAALTGQEGAVDLYRKALELEEKSRDFYIAKAEGIRTEAARGIFYRIAEEEKLHSRILATIVDMLERPEPGRWLENAEWYHQQPY